MEILGDYVDGAGAVYVRRVIYGGKGGMSLRVWLPLTDGTLKQQGLENAAATIGGAVDLNNAGKLGKCATFGTTGGGITLPASTMTSFTECSVAFWIKIISWNTSYATFFQAGLGSTPWAHYIFGILRNGTNSNLCFTLTNSSGSSTSASYTSSNLEVGQWYHLAFTYKAGTVCIYKDGVLDKTYNTTYVPNFAGITHISIGRGTDKTSYKTNCEINDFRIYDHALSLMEVKQLSQGLVLHYPLNHQGFGSENFILESHKVTNGAQASGITRTYENDGTVKFVTTAGNGNYATVYFAKDSKANVGEKMSVGDIYTISCDVKVESGTKLPTLFINSGNGYKQLHGTIILGQWIRAYYTSTWAEPGTSYGNITLHLGFSGVVGTYYFKNFKLEKSNVPTPWTPAPTDELYTTLGLNSNIEYDTSGYCNNGTRTGTFSWTSDTPKYSVSTQFGSRKQITGAILPADALTAAIWIKDTGSLPSSAICFRDATSHLAMGIQSNNLICGASGGAQTAYIRNFSSNQAYKKGEWNHIVIIKNGNSYDIYINGIKQTLSSPSSQWSAGTPNDCLVVGGRGGSDYWPGQLSDLRIYATALSPTDVKSLYQNCATIDPDGTIRGQIRS